MSKIYKHSTRRLFSPKYILTWPLFLFFWLIAQLPHNYLLSIGQFLGKLAYPFFPKRKYIIRTNLMLCFPDKNNEEIEKLLKLNLEYLGIGICETALAWFGPERTIKQLQKNVTIVNEDILKKYLPVNTNKPLLLITPHAASQELLSKILIRQYKFSPVFRHMNNPVANYIMQKARIKIYKTPILKANTRQIVKSLLQKIIIGILPDQDFGKKRSVFVPFFGVPAATTTAVSKYKKLTDANILAISYLRDPKVKNCFTIHISELLNITGTDLEHDARVFNHEFEKIILKDIAMYFWVARRFKTRPDNQAKIYNYS